MGKIRIVIDAGHGSDTAGKRTSPFTKDVDINGDGKTDVKKGEQYREHYANVGIAQLLHKELISRGYEVVKTGWDGANSKNDPDIPLFERQKKIRDAKCDISVSIHFNAFGGGKSFNSAEGTSVYIHDKYVGYSKKLAQCVLNEVIKGTKQKSRGINSQGFAMCNNKSLGTEAAILIEVAFMTNEREAQELMANKRFWMETAVQIANGIDKYYI